MKDSPFISVIMPVRDEAEYMQRSLGAVMAQDYPSQRMEVIVADGMSNDGTREIICDYQNRYSNIRLIDNHEKIVATGLNKAVQESKGEIIIRVDGHCEIAPDYVTRCVEILQREKADVVGGTIETVGETLVAKAIALAMSSSFGVGGSAFRTAFGRKLFVDTLAFGAHHRKVFEKAGPFDEELVRNQDDEFNYRLRKMGFRILLSPEIHSRYYSRASLVSLWKQYFEYGFWKVRVFQKHPTQMQWRQFMPFIFISSLSATFLGCFFIPFLIFVFIPLLGSYLAANFTASLWISSQKGWKFLPALAMAFLILHLSYGFGFLTGLIRFRKRWSKP